MSLILNIINKLIYGFIGSVIEIVLIFILSSWLISHLSPNVPPDQYLEFSFIIFLSTISLWVLSLLIRWVVFRFTFNREKLDRLFWWGLIQKTKHPWIKGIFLIIGFFLISSIVGLVKSFLENTNNIQFSKTISIAYNWWVFGTIAFFVMKGIWNRIMNNRKLKKEHELALQREREMAIQRQIEWERDVARSGIDEIDLMSGKEFEVRMWVHFRQLGWEADLTPGSNDFGADLILKSPAGEKIIAQLKRYKNPVGVKAIQEVAGAINYHNADSGIVITNSRISKQARILAESNKVRIWERDDLVKSLAQVHAQLYNHTEQNR